MANPKMVQLMHAPFLKYSQQLLPQYQLPATTAKCKPIQPNDLCEPTLHPEEDERLRYRKD